MYNKVNYTLVGIFVMLFVAGIFFFAFWLGSRGFEKQYTDYLLRTRDSVTGLSKDSSVKLKGVDVGTVSSIRVNPDDIEEVYITLRIRKDIPIKEDMKATISMFGLTGLSYVEIEGGTNDAKTLHPVDGKMPVIRSGESTITKLQNNLGELSDKVVSILDRGEKVLSDENIKRFSALVKNANDVAANGTELENKAMETLEETTKTVKEFRISFAKLSKDYDALALEINSEIKPSMEKFNKVSEDLNTLVLKINKTVGRGDYNLQKIMRPAMNDIRALSVQLDGLIRELRHSPSDILFKSSKPMRGPGE